MYEATERNRVLMVRDSIDRRINCCGKYSKYDALTLLNASVWGEMGETLISQSLFCPLPFS
jgi:hypothetical protein